MTKKNAQAKARKNGTELDAQGAGVATATAEETTAAEIAEEGAALEKRRAQRFNLVGGKFEEEDVSERSHGRRGSEKQLEYDDVFLTVSDTQRQFASIQSQQRFIDALKRRIESKQAELKECKSQLELCQDRLHGLIRGQHELPFNEKGKEVAV